MSFDKSVLEDEIDELIYEIMDIRASGDCLEECDSRDDAESNLETIIADCTRVIEMAKVLKAKL